VQVTGNKSQPNCGTTFTVTPLRVHPKAPGSKAQSSQGEAFRSFYAHFSPGVKSASSFLSFLCFWCFWLKHLPEFRPDRNIRSCIARPRLWQGLLGPLPHIVATSTSAATRPCGASEFLCSFTQCTCAVFLFNCTTKPLYSCSFILCCPTASMVHFIYTLNFNHSIQPGPSLIGFPIVGYGVLLRVRPGVRIDEIAGVP
jgi:hypothetical protein